MTMWDFLKQHWIFSLIGLIILLIECVKYLNELSRSKKDWNKNK